MKGTIENIESSMIMDSNDSIVFHWRKINQRNLPVYAWFQHIVLIGVYNIYNWIKWKEFKT